MRRRERDSEKVKEREKRVCDLFVFTYSKAQVRELGKDKTVSE